MNTTPIPLHDLAHLLTTAFAADRYTADEQGGIYRPSDRPVQRLGIALEPWPGLRQWVINNQLDALWLHRPWHLDLTTLPAEVGVLYNHLPFDETLTMGFNQRLATALDSLGKPETLGFKQATDKRGGVLPLRPIGMLFDSAEQEFDDWLDRVNRLFCGYDRAEMGCQTSIRRIAVVGAMNDALVREAASRGANVYLTGQYRKPGQAAVDETGIALIALGHRRTEVWGLRALADLLGEHVSIDCLVHE
jgi:putative NIF3 family GTP cyclohydrolase 1 type 2